MEFDELDSHAALTRFLRERRRRLQPLDASLPSGGVRRRQSGLRRDELAELLGVSAHWYSLFESATSGRRFSRTFLGRVMDVLALDQADRETLQTLAVACGAVPPDPSLALDAARLRRILDTVARLSRALAGESNVTRAWTIAIAGLRDTVAVGDIAVKVFMRDGDTMRLLFKDERNSGQADRNVHPRSSIAVPIGADGRMNGEQMLFDILPGASFGIAEMLDGGHGIVNVTTGSAAATVVLIPRELVLDAMAADEELARAIALCCAQHLRYIADRFTARIDELAVDRVASTILAFSSADAGLVPPLIPLGAMTQAELAARSGTAKEVAARAVASFETAGAIVRAKGHIALVDRERLATFISR